MIGHEFTSMGDAPSSILIVEDELVVALDIKRILEKRGYSVVGVVDTGESAIESVERLRPDLILMDITLRGGLDGIETTGRITDRFDLPVIYLTSHSDEDTIGKIKKSNVYGYLTKPVNPSELPVAVGIALNKHSAEKRVRESERKYRDLIEGMSEGVWVINEREKTEFINPRMAEMLGIPESGITGVSFLDFVAPESTSAALAQVDHCRRGLKGQYTYSLRRPDGSDLYVSVVSSPIFADGQYSGFLACVQDFTRQKKLEDSLRDSEERYRILVETSPDAIFLTDRDGKILFCNAQAAYLQGYEAVEDVPAGNFLQIVTEDDRSGVRSLLNAILESGSTGMSEFRVSGNHGDYLTVDVKASPVKDARNRVKAFIFVVRDITEARKIEQHLQRTQKLESIGLLAGGIAHDFNNILMVIAGNISLAKLRVENNPKVLELLAGAENATMRARDLTQQLLVFSRGGNPVRKTTSIAELLGETVNFSLRGSKSICVLNIENDIWPAMIDEGQINQVFHNLVINADQAMPDGGIITIHADNFVVEGQELEPLKPGRYVRISVVDQGTGITNDHFQKVFDPYFTTKEKGTGLGLAIVYSIIKKHKGHIDLSSQYGKGTTFIVYLPASDQPVSAADEQAQSVAEGSGKILIMDDMPEIRETVQLMLGHLGYEVSTAADGREAVDCYTKAFEDNDPFDLVIMDLTVPGKMGGMEALKLLQEIDPDVRAIVSSGYSNDPVLSDYRRYGFRGAVIKPYRLNDLVKSLRDAMSRDR